MKSLMVLWILYIPLMTVYSQTKRKSFTKNLDDVELVYKNGDSERGTIPNLVENWGVNSIWFWREKNSNIKSDKFKLIDAKGNEKLINSDEIASIFVYDDEEYREIRRLDIKKINNKGKIVDMDEEIWLPVTIDNDKISVLSYNLYVAYSANPYKKAKEKDIDKAQYGGTMVYLQRNDEDFAILPIDVRLSDLFNSQGMGDRFKIALKEIYRDCDAVLKLIDKDWDVSNREARKGYKKLIKETSQMIKKLPKNERKLAWDNFYTEYMLSFYKPFMEKYKATCISN